mgnify:FL=1
MPLNLFEMSVQMRLGTGFDSDLYPQEQYCFLHAISGDKIVTQKDGPRYTGSEQNTKKTNKHKDATF